MMQVQEVQPALPLRAHTILGVCEALGEDFGFNPMWLRVPFAASVLFSVEMAIGAYLALGLIVLASRLLFPKAKPDAAVDGATATGATADAANSEEQKLPLAA
jgi:phage shock protein PspC (stress-responsive transcriptional regulator)